MTDEPKETQSFDEMVNSLVDGEPEAKDLGAAIAASPEEGERSEPAAEAAEEPVKKTRSKKAERASGLIITDDLPESTKLEMAAGRAALMAKMGS